MDLPYRIDRLEYPQDDDRRYATEEDAEIAAIALSYNDSVIAVWYSEDGEEDGITALVYQQVVYSP